MSGLSKLAVIMLDFVCVIAKAIFIAFIIYGVTMLIATNLSASTKGELNKKGINIEAIKNNNNGSVFIACSNDNEVNVNNIKTNTDGSSSFDIVSVDSDPRCKGEVR